MDRARPGTRRPASASSRRRRTTTSTRSRTSRSSSTTSRTPTRRPGSTSSWSPRSASARSRPGVTKAHADVVLISGHDGGTGASPLTSLKHAGAPWELGLAETQQTLRAQRPARPHRRAGRRPAQDRPRRRHRRRCSAPRSSASPPRRSSSSGCIMMRVCHLDTCPVGIATQNPELRARFTGKPEFVETFFEYIAEEVREHLAALGFRSHRGGRRPASSCSTPTAAIEHWKAVGPRPHARSSPWPTTRPAAPLHQHGAPGPRPREGARPRAHRAAPGRAIEHGEPVRIELPVRNVNRTVGTMLGHEVTKAHPHGPAPTARSTSRSPGRPGSRFGAFLPAGITLRLYGDANDYVGKGLSGGRVVVRPRPRRDARRPSTTSSPATSSATAPRPASCSCAAGRRAVLRAQLRRDRRRRGRRRPRAAST